MADVASGRLNYPTEQEMLRVSREMGGPSPEAIRRIAREMREASRSGVAARPDVIVSRPSGGKSKHAAAASDGTETTGIARFRRRRGTRTGGRK
jgi:hypothetical protein